MKSRLRLSFALSLSIALLAACSKTAPDAPAPAGPTGSNAAATVPEVVPHTSDAPASANANGPGDAATAVGGMSANQDAGGATKGAPAPTAGDGASAASSPR